MNKRTPLTIFGVILLLGLVGVGIYFGFVRQASVPLSTPIGNCAGGWTSFSIDDVTINADKSRIRVFGVAKGSECLSIKLTKDDLNSELSDEGVEATRDIIGSVRLLDYTKTFPIDKLKNPDGSDLYYPSLESETFGNVFTFCSLDACKSKVSADTIQVFRGTAVSGCTCVYPGGNGLVGDFSAARSYGYFDVEFVIGGIDGRLSREQQSIAIGNHYVEWVGNLMNLDEIYPPQYDARLILSKWDLVNDGSYNTIRSEINDYLACYERELTWWQPQGAFDTCKSEFDTQANLILSNKLSKYKEDASALIYDADTDANALYVSLKAPPFPAFILDLDAEDVGIIALEGKPKITSCIPTQPGLRSGQNKVVTFDVKNEIDVDNVEFYGSIVCNQGVTGFFPNFNIDGLQEKTISVELIPVNPNEQDLSFNCQVKVNDLKSGNFDTCSFTGSIAYESGIICQPGSLKCDSGFNNVLICDEAGTNLKLYQECEFGCQVVAGVGQCIGEPIPQIECNKIFEDYYEKETCGMNVLCWVGIDEPVTERGCKLKTWVYVAILGLILAIIIVVLVVVRKVKRRIRG